MLRHLVGLLAGVALAPVLWVAVAWPADLVPQIIDGDVSVATVSSVVVLMLTGLGCSYLVASRLSPLIAATSGLLLVALVLWPIVSPASADSVLGPLNNESFLHPSGGHGPAIALLLGTLLFGASLTPTRWRALQDLPDGSRVVASAGRDQYRPPPSEEVGEEAPWTDGGPAGDTIPKHFPPPEPVPPPGDPGPVHGDPNKTTTPFRRGETGAVWTPLDDAPGETRAFGDGRM